MDRRAKVELFEQLRHEYEFGVGTVSGVASKFHVHRRQVRQALESSIPPERKALVRPCPILEPVKSFIEAILVSDKTAPRKQRHTAHRIWMRLCAEKPLHPVAESTVRAYVRERKWALGLAGREINIPQCYAFGIEAQVDWYEAHVVLDGARLKVQIFNMRSMKSGAAFHRAYLHATQQAFFEAHEEAFAYFGGVFHTLRYDNLSSAVKKLYRGYTRDEHTRFIAFRSHWQFASEFCSPAQPQEKGGVEGEVGFFRRNHLVPVPEVADLAALNHKLLADCIADQARRIGDREEPVGELMAVERQHLQAFPKDRFDLAESHSGLVDAKGCVKSRLNCYSTPLRVGTKTVVRVLPSLVEIWHCGTCVATHDRCYDRGKEIYNLEHYLNVFHKKPGAFPGSRPLAQWRDRGLWPQSLDDLWVQWQTRLGKHEGTRAMVDLLLFARPHGWSALQRAACEAIRLGCTDESAVQCLLKQSSSAIPVKLSAEDLGGLSRYDRPMPEMSGYDQLLAGAI